jgi:hypothetical protein
MGMIETLWAYISGKPSEVARSSTGGAGAVKPPTLDIKFEDGSTRYTTHSVDDVPKLAQKTLKMISRKKGATIDEVHAVVGKKRSSVYNHIYLIKKAGYEIVKTYDKKSGTHRYRLG